MSRTSKAFPSNLLSIVIPVYNEAESIEACITEVSLTLIGAQIPYELIIVNDGSSDLTLKMCLGLKSSFDFRLIHIPVNSGHMAAITAGLEASNGEFVATMDADLQDPPKDLPKMYEIITQKEKNQIIEKLMQYHQ